VIARDHGGSHLGTRPAGTDRHAVAKGLGHGHHVGLEVLVLEGEPLAGAPEPGLHLVDHQERPVLGAQVTQAAQVVRRRDHHTALTLDRLHQDSRHISALQALAMASRSSKGTAGKPAGMGSNPVCLAACPVAASAASVRPWNEFSVETTT